MMTITLVRKMNKQERMEELSKLIYDSARIETEYRKRARALGIRAAKLFARESKWLEKATAIAQKRHEYAVEYNKIKNPCPEVIISAEKALGRKLTIDEVFEIEAAYAKKIGGKNG